jgi:glycosyltransferase involved in cell wall biosynthesis
MKIVIVVEEFDAAKGYLEYHLAKKLTELGHDIHVFSFGRSYNELKVITSEGFHLIRLPHAVLINGYKLPNPFSLTYILNFLRNERPNVVHCQPIDSPLSLIFVFYSALFDYKIVGPIMTQLNLVFSPWGFTKKILFCVSKIVVTKYVARKSALLFAKTYELMKILSRSYNLPKSKFRIIPLGTDPQFFKFNPAARYQIRQEMNLSEEDVLIMYSGKLDPSKGIDLLIKALSEIMNTNDKVKLLIIGKGRQSYVEYLKNLLSEFSLSSNTFFRPWANREELCKLYSASDVAVWPGLSSISIIDAASVGLPLIIANVPVESYAVSNKNGFTFEVGNVNDLQANLQVLIDNEKLRKKMSLRSRYLVENQLNWKFVATKYYDAYKEASEL